MSRSSRLQLCNPARPEVSLWRAFSSALAWSVQLIGSGISSPALLEDLTAATIKTFLDIFYLYSPIVFKEPHKNISYYHIDSYGDSRRYGGLGSWENLARRLL